MIGIIYRWGSSYGRGYRRHTSRTTAFRLHRPSFAEPPIRLQLRSAHPAEFIFRRIGFSTDATLLGLPGDHPPLFCAPLRLHGGAAESAKLILHLVRLSARPTFHRTLTPAKHTDPIRTGKDVFVRGIQSCCGCLPI